ncbi:UDP-glucose 6-dehydrogenase TuaD [compost metagenome]
MKIGIIGTGYVGLTSGICFSELGNQVICADINPDKIDCLNDGIIPIYEQGLKELVDKNLELGRIKFTTDISQVVTQSDIIFIAVGTPALPDGNVNLSYVYKAAKDIASYINSYKIIVNKSTVPVGTAENVRNIIKSNMEDRLIEFDVASVPEFLKEGSAVEDFMKAERVIIGVDSESAKKLLLDLHSPLKTLIQVTDIRSAELIKYAANSFLAMKISFINEIANIAELTGADVNEVAKGIGSDSRIGKQFLNAGIGYGGSCFPKDTKGLIKIAEQVGHHFKLLEEVVNINDSQHEKVIQKLVELHGNLNNKIVSLLGLSFKPKTNDIRDAPSIKIIHDLLTRYPEIIIRVYDPVALSVVKQEIGDIVRYCYSIEEAVSESDTAVIVTEWEEIVSFGFSNFKRLLRQPIVLDGRNCFIPNAAYEAGIIYYSIGRTVNITQNII